MLARDVGQMDLPYAAQPQEIARRGLNTGGSPLDPDTRTHMEASFGQDFGQVRLHTGGQAAETAASIHARAFTVGQDIAFGPAGFSPGAGEGRRLLAHELTHVVQQRRGVQLPGGMDHVTDSYERHAHALAEQVVSGRSAEALVSQGPAPQGGASSGVVQRQVDPSQIPGHPGMPSPEDFIERYRSKYPVGSEKWVPELSSRLFWVMWQGEDHYPFVMSVLEELREYDLDDNVATAMVLGGHDKDLDDLSTSPAGRTLLNHLYEHIITGELAADDEQAARSILYAKTRQIPMETFIEGAQQAQIFPVRQMGITRFNDDSPLEAERLPNGKIRVKLMSRVQHEPMFKEEVKTLRGGTFSPQGQEIDPNEIIGVRDYDLGGEVEFFPAEALLMLSSKSHTATLQTIGKVSMAAATMGVGGAGGAASGWSRVLLWADRAAMAVSALGLIVNEHRQWMTDTFGKSFVRAIDVANNVVGVYGVARLAGAAGSMGFKLTENIRNQWTTFRKHPRFPRIEASPAGKQIINKLDDAIGKLPTPPQSLGQRVAKGIDEWASQPAGGLSMLGIKEADELLKAGWRKIRGIKAKTPIPTKKVATTSTKTTTTPTKRTTTTSTKKVATTKKVAPAKKATPTKKVAPTRKTVTTKKAALAKKATPTKKVAPTKKFTPAKKVATPTKKFNTTKKAAPTKKTTPPTNPAKPRNRYPDFETLTDDQLATAAGLTQKLSSQLGIPIKKDRVLSAPWIGRIRGRSGKTRSISTSQGWLRSEDKFWEMWKKTYPNDAKMLGPGNTVTQKLAKEYGWPDKVVGQKLIHHHVENSTFTVALPHSLHEKLSGKIHAKATVVGE
jgi:outer membrane biosynthesis protein TonB